MERPNSSRPLDGPHDHEVRAEGQIALKKEEVLSRQLNGLPCTNNIRTVFAYATRFDLVVILFSCISAIIAGALNPLLTVIYGQLVGIFSAFSNQTISGAELSASLSKFTLYFVYLAIGEFIFIYLTTIGFYCSGERIVRKLRFAYLEAVLRQNMAFFDLLSVGEVTARITSDTNLIHEGITSKISLSLTAAATLATAFVIAFVEYWKLALILTCSVVAMAATGTAGAAIAVRHTKQSREFYRSGVMIAEEAIGSIRHVAAFGIEETLASRHFAYVLNAEKSGMKAGIIIALMIAVMHGIPYVSYGLSFWQGSRFVVNGSMSGKGVVTTTLAIVIGAFAVGRVTPNAQAFASSVASASGILKAISRRSSQDPFSVDGLKPERADVEGEIQFKHVRLVYPSRPDVIVIDDLNLEIPAGKITALVGPSGCGKSSIIELIERFYEPVNGHITLGGYDIQSLNLQWMRAQIASVAQEPTLFSTTIFQNIQYGLSPATGQLTVKELHALVVTAARNANAHAFIMALPRGYDTEVGERGLQLSAGQRQRIAIARALISGPKILLLDEATSALDARSERAVQKALETASVGRTTILIAHRLSTVQNADKIVVLSNGRVIEQGRHGDLMSQKGSYFNLVKKQSLSQRVRASAGHIVELDVRDEDNETTLDNEKGIISKAEENSNMLIRSDMAERMNKVSKRGIANQPGTAQVSLWSLTKVLRKLTHPEHWIIFIGLCCSIIVGLGSPVQSVFFAMLVDALSLPPPSYGILQQKSDFWSLMYLMLGIVGCAARFGQGACFSYSSEKLTQRARDQSFRYILRQDIAFFDHNSSGALTAFLSAGTTHLNSLSGAILGSLLSFSSTIIGGIILSLLFGWKLALVCSATIPIVAGCGWVRLKMLAVFDGHIKTAHSESAAYATEAVNAIRTVASLGMENDILRHYNEILAQQAVKSLRAVLQASALYAASQSCVFLCAALGFWYGGKLIATHEYTMIQFFVCFAALISGSQSAGAIFSFAPDMSKAMHAGRDMKVLFDRRPQIDTWDIAGRRVDGEKCIGHIKIDNVSFSYPTRPERLVLKDFSISIQPGHYVALVGSSGCGKSTIISLLERFFDPSSGQIYVDGVNIPELNLNDYRRVVALVSQETTVYQGTIRENVVLGSTGEVSEEDIIRACKEANIYDFILSLPETFSTVVGSHGSLLSGGQKQRIAIARALLRNPRILLLDEATSALDATSEKLVQEALDAAAQQRTTIAVAQRLSTIQNADLICVLDQGRIIEAGTHTELMVAGGAYCEMVELQRLQGEMEG